MLHRFQIGAGIFPGSHTFVRQKGIGKKIERAQTDYEKLSFTCFDLRSPAPDKKSKDPYKRREQKNEYFGEDEKHNRAKIRLSLRIENQKSGGGICA
jgi:hypothetical protein